jgi:hypothetical protein
MKFPIIVSLGNSEFEHQPENNIHSINNNIMVFELYTFTIKVQENHNWEILNGNSIVKV